MLSTRQDIRGEIEKLANTLDKAEKLLVRANKHLRQEIGCAGGIGAASAEHEHRLALHIADFGSLFCRQFGEVQTAIKSTRAVAVMLSAVINS